MHPNSLANLVPFKEGDDERRNLNGNTGGGWISSEIRKLIEGEMDLDVDGESRKINGAQAIAITLFKIATDKTSNEASKLRAIAEIIDRLEGKAQQTVHQNNTGDQTLTIIRSGNSYPPVIHSPSSTGSDTEQP